MDYNKTDQPTYETHSGVLDRFNITPIVIAHSASDVYLFTKPEEFPVKDARFVITRVKSDGCVYKLISKPFPESGHSVYFTAEFSIDGIREIKEEIPKHLKKYLNL